MCHVEFRDSSEFRDVEAVNYYKKLLSEGKTEREAFSIVAPGTRDQSRAPMQWTAGENAGFTTGTPWLRLNDNYTAINAEAEEKEEKEKKYFLKTFQSCSYSQSFNLPSLVNPDGVEAKFEDGVLTITLPKAKESESKQISIK